MKGSHFYYSERYTLPLPPDHRFPIQKYEMIRDRLLAEKILNTEQIRESPLASKDELMLAHDLEYILGIECGVLPRESFVRIGFPWSEALWLRSCATVGGLLAATQEALKTGVSGNLAGGTHHAHRDRGEGYCVFNDIAVCARYLKKHGLAKRIAIIDLDVHQGNGNSSILGQDEGVFIFSIHGEKNYPFKKIPSHLDIALPDQADDLLFHSALDQGMPHVEAFNPDFIFYQMGVDGLKEDKLGRMALTHQGLMERDRKVFNFAFRNQIPVVLSLGGGYADPIESSVEAYVNTYRTLKEIYQ